MKSKLLSGVSEQRTAAIHQFFDIWKRSAHKVEVLEESLRYLSSDSRRPASSLLNSGTEITDLCCTYGKGTRPKLSLSKDDATLLLDIVLALKKASAKDELTSDMMKNALAIILDGSRPVAERNDDSFRRLLEILGSMDPQFKQGLLF